MRKHAQKTLESRRTDNAGKMPHEFGIGTAEQQKAHAEMMQVDPEMRHDDSRVIRMAPSKVGTLIWRFWQGRRVRGGLPDPGA